MGRLIYVIRQYPILLILAAFAVVFALASPDFGRPDNITNILRQSSMLGFVALGMSFVILAGGIDLSVGSTLALATVIVTVMSRTLPPALGINAALFAGVAVGVINGVLVTRFRFQPIIATLVTMASVRGIAMVFSNSQAIFGTLPNDYFLLSDAELAGLPLPAILFGIAALLSGFYLHFTRHGREIYQVGGNEEAARLAGVDVESIKITTYAICGFMAAVAGLILAARTQSGEAVRTGLGWELNAIAAAAIGGMSLMGGVGTIIGTVSGTLIIGMMSNAFNLLGIDPNWQRIVVGVLLAVAVASYSNQDLLRALRSRANRAAAPPGAGAPGAPAE